MRGYDDVKFRGGLVAQHFGAARDDFYPSITLDLCHEMYAKTVLAPCGESDGRLTGFLAAPSMKRIVIVESSPDAIERYKRQWRFLDPVSWRKLVTKPSVDEVDETFDLIVVPSSGAVPSLAALLRDGGLLAVVDDASVGRPRLDALTLVCTATSSTWDVYLFSNRDYPLSDGRMPVRFEDLYVQRRDARVC